LIATVATPNFEIVICKPGLRVRLEIQLWLRLEKTWVWGGDFGKIEQ